MSSIVTEKWRFWHTEGPGRDEKLVRAEITAENMKRFTEDLTSCILEVFALAYLGDYYIAVSDMDRAGKYLLKARRMFPGAQDWEEPRLGLTGFLGIYYDMRGDEQNAIAYYLKAYWLVQMSLPFPWDTAMKYTGRAWIGSRCLTGRIRNCIR